MARGQLIGMLIAGLSLVACSSDPMQTVAQQAISNQPTQSAQDDVFYFPHLRPIEATEKTLADFRRLDNVLTAIKQGDDVAPAQFLVTQNQSAMAETVRNEWLKSLGKRGSVHQFKQQYQQLSALALQQEVRCYAHIYGLENNPIFVQNLLNSITRLPEGCQTLLENAARHRALDTDRAWRRVRGLISSNQITQANGLATALGSPLSSATGLGYQENILREVIGSQAQKSPDVAANRLNQLSGSLNAQQQGFAWGVLATAQAKSHNMNTALTYYRRAQRSQLSDEQFEWYARVALRLQQWRELREVIQSMPKALQQTPTWQYWLARSLAATGQPQQAQAIYQQVAQTGRNFYAVLAMEELGLRVDTRNNVAPAKTSDIRHLAQDGAIVRALTLFQASKQTNDWQMRRQAQAEWRYATREMNEATLLAAAELAFQHEFYEMAINSAERTHHLLNYPLRYLTPYRDLVVHYGQQHQVDPAWVYGLIRQESRFMIGAKSSAGAQGLMQVMPATAREIARKIGMNSNELYTIEGNVRMGTWYMADSRRRLQNNEVLATAGYNAGPARARRWQADSVLEGAIYAETIPFNETRDYVKRVMTNSVYYASLLNEPQTSLKQRMGSIPAR